ncbi:methyl-accepting chemotaxis protein [Planctobacterium marinum]|uniref:Methyl-accepting chemotaxis protein n=1 Tax=Planctobacterium marinum TaxID=1631968 RepID=A0AA48HUG6_9ALTE|nr:methyl-accepting chemotaxis protein [Planctobacterium marinum]
MTLQSRLVSAIALIVFVALLTNVTINSSLSIAEMNEALLDQYQKDLVSKRSLVKGEIENYFHTIEGQLTALATNKTVLDASREFISAFEGYSNERAFDNQIVSKVSNYYQNQFQSEYQLQNNDSANTTAMLSGLSENALLLQHDFIVQNPNPLGNKDRLYELNNGTQYAKVHATYHETFKVFLETFAYYDVFIVDAQTGNLVYSVFKELDFATNLRSGPYAQSGIAEAFNKAVNLQPGQTWLTDFKAYLPSYNNPASFIATPVYDEGTVSAVLIFQMPISRLNDIMTHEQKWQDSGFGDSGEIYLIGEDQTLRNESRFWVEDKKAYLATLKSRGYAEVASEIQLKNTSIALQPVRTSGANKALRGQSGFEIIEDYRGVKVLSAYAAVEVGPYTWGILAEIDEEEAFAPTHELTAKIWGYSTLVTALMIAASVVLTFYLAKMLIKPLLKISDEFQALTSEDANLTTRIPESGIPEIDRIANGFNQFIEQIRKIISIVKQSAEMISSASTELSATTEQTNQAAQGQQQDAEEVTLSIQQFNQAIQEVSENSVLAANSTSEAKQNTEKNSQRAAQTSENIGLLVQEVTQSANTLQTLQTEVENINEVLVVINSIADQTNLLALNAAIEAARAGEHGRGFAVVADEVRNLASRTQESTVEIQGKIAQLTTVANNAVSSMGRASNSAEEGIELVESVNQSLQQLNQQITQLASVNSAVASASEQQKYTCDEINRNVEHVRESSTELCQASDEIARSAVGLAEIAADLQQEVGRFRT